MHRPLAESYSELGSVYVLHFSKPFKHANHYIGWTAGAVEDRVSAHQHGLGATLTREAVRAGITFTIAQVIPDVTREIERKMKNGGGSSRCCNICRAKRGMGPHTVPQMTRSGS